MTRNRNLGRLLQREYWKEHQECEWCGSPDATVHEIFYGCLKFYDYDNFFTLCQQDHDDAHAGILTREMICKAKGIDYETLRRKAMAIRGCR